MPELHELTANAAAQGIREGEITPVELMEALLDRTNALEPRLKAWVYMDQEAALLDAEQKHRELEGGAPVGPLHGVPVGLKDIYYTAGIPTTACSRLYAGFIPDHDATTVALLKGSGAIVMGKTVTTEFACMDPSPTLNPWNPFHTPGGSSSGSAVSVASRMCPVALGSQTVGSVLRPASYNGVVGFKPSFSRVSRYGVIPVSWSLDHVGWMSRSVEDAALLLQVLAGPDPNDSVASHEPVPDYLDGLDSALPPRIGLVRQFFWEHADEEVQQHTDAAVEKLRLAGAPVEEVDLPSSIATAIEDQQVVMAVEGAAFHQPMFEKRGTEYQPKLREMLGRGLSTSSTNYSRAQEHRQQFIVEMARLAEQVDVLLTPSTPTPALADLTNTGNTMFQGPWTSCGLPVITIPSGLAESGLPLGVQIAGAFFKEKELLAAARWCEKVLDVNLAPPL